MPVLEGHLHRLQANLLGSINHLGKDQPFERIYRLMIDDRFHYCRPMDFTDAAAAESVLAEHQRSFEPAPLTAAYIERDGERTKLRWLIVDGKVWLAPENIWPAALQALWMLCWLVLPLTLILAWLIRWHIRLGAWPDVWVIVLEALLGPLACLVLLFRGTDCVLSISKVFNRKANEIYRSFLQASREHVHG